MGQTIRITSSDGFVFDAYVTGPADAKAGIVVIQEIFGVNHHIRDMADRFGAAGYSVIAPCVYDRAEKNFEVGYTADDIARGRDVRMKLDDTKLMLDIDAAAKHLGKAKTGIVGYCFGGTASWWGATRSKSFAAASCWYGGGIPGTKNEVPGCPTQMHFGEKDGSIPMNDVDAVRAAQPKVDVYVYMGAQHGFGCDERGSYSKPDYDLAQQRTLDFFKANLA